MITRSAAWQRLFRWLRGKQPDSGPAVSPRQKRIPQIKDWRIEELHAHAELVLELRDDRHNLQQRIDEAEAELLAAMKKNGRTRYHCDGIEITVGEKEVLKLRPIKQRLAV